MPTVEKTTGGRLRSRVADEEFVGGETYEVDAKTAEYLVDERGGFEVVESDRTDTDTSADDAGESPDNDEEPDDNSDAEADIEEYLDDNNVDEISDDIHDGQFDDQLTALDEAAERVGVQDAIGERRAELEG